MVDARKEFEVKDAKYLKVIQILNSKPKAKSQ